MLERLIMFDLFNGFYRGKRVLVTGHTGFKGSWLCLWLRELADDISRAYETNVMGTIHVLEAFRRTPSASASMR